MRNGGCVPGHSINTAFHQSRGGEAPLLVSVSPYAHLTAQTTRSLATGSRALSYSYTYAFTRPCGWEHIHTHGDTQTNTYTPAHNLKRTIYTRLNVHIQTHYIYTFMWSYVNVGKHKHAHVPPCTRAHVHRDIAQAHHHTVNTTHSTCSPLGDIHNFHNTIFLWSLQAHSTSEHKIKKGLHHTVKVKNSIKVSKVTCCLFFCLFFLTFYTVV